MNTHILGIRHHGPGSARNVRDFLENLKPDLILVEGPPDADNILQWITHEELKPPVAILLYQSDDPQQSVFYPFAEFSPEWQAILYAKRNNIHVRFMDLPAAHSFALRKEEIEKAKAAQQEQEDSATEEPTHESEITLEGEAANEPATGEISPIVYRDPIRYLAEAAGYSDGEKWWETFFEHRHNNEAIFEAVAEAMQSLRDNLPEREDRHEMLREAYMRKSIRQAEKEMFSEVAVICGAWHVPALKNMPKQKEDNDLLKGLPKVKVESTWVPWTYSRLSYFSGYGAGIGSPGWYHHVWNYPGDDGTRWMAGIAKLFREQNIDTSVAHVIDAVRLANALASMRGMPKAGLEELNEATRSVLCMGEDILLQLIQDELIVSNRIGKVPEDIPKPPLQLDIEKHQKKLRLPATADFKDYQLDLRKDTDLDRSIFLNRLLLLGIHWGTKLSSASKGTFKEGWRLQWDPAYSVDIIEKGSWGNSVEEATTQYVLKQARASDSLQVLTGLMEMAIWAELPGVIDVIISGIGNMAASSGDVLQLMEVLPQLVNVGRYGNVRKTDTSVVLHIAYSMITRICIALPPACTGVNDEAAEQLVILIDKMNDAIKLLQDNATQQEWQTALNTIASNEAATAIISGYATRLLYDHRQLTGDELADKFTFALSVGNTHSTIASWLEGFLKGSGTILLLDEALWGMVATWVSSIDQPTFDILLPLLRRTFANFSNTERRKLGEKVKSGSAGTGATYAITRHDNFNHEKAKRGLLVITKLLGVKLGSA